MLAFEVTYDGADPLIVGQDDWSVLSMTLTAVTGDFEGGFDLDSHLGGLSKPDAESISQHFRWNTPAISVGSVIQIRVVEASDVARPNKRYRSDNEVQDEYTAEEKREMRYEAYLRLKDEFEK